MAMDDVNRLKVGGPYPPDYVKPEWQLIAVHIVIALDLGPDMGKHPVTLTSAYIERLSVPGINQPIDVMTEFLAYLVREVVSHSTHPDSRVVDLDRYLSTLL